MKLRVVWGRMGASNPPTSVSLAPHQEIQTAEEKSMSQNSAKMTDAIHLILTLYAHTWCVDCRK